MHADMAKEIQIVPRSNRQSQQQACSKWRQEFNHVRPHSALGDKTPAELYKPSLRRMRTLTALYPSGWLVRKVGQAGHVRIASEMHFVSGSLSGFHIGLQPIDALNWRAWFYDVDLGLVQALGRELPDKVIARALNTPSVPTCSNASSVRARTNRAPATPRLTRSARVSQKQVSKRRTDKRSRSTAKSPR